MSTINSKNVQVGTSGVANQNFTLYQPNTPDGTVRLGVGNSGVTTSDVVTVTNAGNMTVSGVLTATTLSGAITGGAVTATSLAVSGATTTTSLAVNSNNISAVNSLGFRNRIINGDMRIDQRYAGASVTPATDTYTLDRWGYAASQASKFTVQQNAAAVTPPAGFTNYLGATVASAVTIGASDFFWIQQFIEGYNIADLGWGSANAQTVTLSFWVRSSLTGTFGGAVQNSANNRSYPFTFTISAANTWEFETVTIPGDTTGTWLTTNGKGIRLSFGLGVGSDRAGTAGAWAAANYASATGAVSVVGTGSATFYVTGVQLEAGSVATPFERLDYGRELIMCQRYYYRQSASTAFAFFLNGFNNSTTRLFGIFIFPQLMRTTPVLETTGTASNYQVLYSGSSAACTGISLDGQTTNFSAFVIADVASGLTAGQGAILRANNTTSAYLGYSSEL